MPAVTVPSRPSGEPIAITGSPTASCDDLPSVATVSAVSGTLSTARSLIGSSPTICALAVSSSENVATIVPPPLATSATWSLVSTYPCLSITTPEPTP